MKVSLEISAEYIEPYATIYANKVTDEIQRTLEIFGKKEVPITELQNEDNLVVLRADEIYMVKVENGDTIIFGQNQKYRSRKRLYEIERQLGRQFMQISKSTLVNIDKNQKKIFGFVFFLERERHDMCCACRIVVFKSGKTCT